MRSSQKFIPLEHETRQTVPTAVAAFHLNRSQQTMRRWSCYQDGPIKPVRINGQLAWPVADIKRIVGWRDGSVKSTELIAADLAEENARLRKIIADCATAIGSYLHPDCSLEFMEGLPVGIKRALEKRSDSWIPVREKSSNG